jgi:histidyl-tRNA synthetase
MFRHERPQAGRLRQFHQFGVESFGSASPLADVEVISLLWRFLTDLQLPGLTLEMNSLGDQADRTAYKAILIDFLQQRKDRLCQNCQRRMETNPLRVLDCKVPECRTATEDAPSIMDSLSPSSRAHFEQVQTGLKDLEISYVTNPRLVRGLDYYTLTTFEVTSHHLGAQNAVGAGGRYDGLVETLGGPKTPAIGFAVGLERVSLMLPDSVVLPVPKLVAVAAFGPQGSSLGIRILNDLRSLGVPADTDSRATSLKAHLRQADRMGASYVVMIGDDEVAKGRALIRNMMTKEQEEIPLSTVAYHLAERLR